MYAAHVFNETHTFGHTHLRIYTGSQARHGAAAAVVAVVLCFCKVSMSYISIWLTSFCGKKLFRVYIGSMMGIYQPVREPSSVIMNLNVLI